MKHLAEGEEVGRTEGTLEGEVLGLVVGPPEGTKSLVAYHT